MKKHAVKLIESCGSFEYTRKRIQEMGKEMLAECDRLGGNPVIEAMVNDWNNMRQFGILWTRDPRVQDDDVTILELVVA